MEIKTTQHCPKCNSGRIKFAIDIFSMKETGELECAKCKHEFKKEGLIKKKWVPLVDYEKMEKSLKSQLDHIIRYANKLENKLHPHKKGEPHLVALRQSHNNCNRRTI